MSGFALFGVLAIKLGRASAEEVEAAAQEQARLKDSGVERRLGEILRDRKVLSDGDIMEILSYQGTVELAMDDTLFGELAVNNGFLNKTQLEACLKRQTEDDHLQRIGEIMVERGFITVHQREALLYMQGRLRDMFS